MTVKPADQWIVVTESLGLLRAAAAMVHDTGIGDAGIGDTGRAAPTPCAEWTVTQVLQHAVGDQLAWAAVLGVGTGPAENPFAPSGHIETGVDALIEPALAAARAAWAGVAADDGAVPTPLPQGRLSAQVAAGACALDAAVHAWDIAVALGRPGFLPNSLAEQLLPAARAVVEPLRPFAYAAALPPQPADAPAAELLRYLGRDPQWQPGDAHRS